MNTIKHYLSIYRKFIDTCFAEASSFRLNFSLLILMDIIFYVSSIFSVDFIYDHVNTIGGWTRYQLLFFISFMLTIDNLHMGVLSESFWMLARHIKTGDLDYIILKPVNTVFNIFFRYFRPSSLFYSFVVWGVLIYFGIKVELSPLSWALLPILVLLGFSLMAFMEFIISALMFYMIEGIGINFLRMQVQNISRWPDFIFSPLPKRVFTLVVPALVVGSAPVKFLLDNNQWMLLLNLVIANIVTLGVLCLVWPIALRKYESASS